MPIFHFSKSFTAYSSTSAKPSRSVTVATATSAVVRSSRPLSRPSNSAASDWLMTEAKSLTYPRGPGRVSCAKVEAVKREKRASSVKANANRALLIAMYFIDHVLSRPC